MSEPGVQSSSVDGVKVSAYVPCFNNAPTIEQAVESVRSQTRPVDEVFVVDDGSTDASPEIITTRGIQIISHFTNLGRGAARAAAMNKANGEFVLSCDATCALPANFVEGALPWFNDPHIAAVFGRFAQPRPRNAVERWRGRHLYRIGVGHIVRHRALLSTHGTIVRRSAVEAVGGYDRRLRHTEDGELGRRLLAAGWDVVCDPGIQVLSIGSNTLAQVFERYWRWNAGEKERTSWRQYRRAIAYAVRVMAREDLAANDAAAAAFTLLSPHYCFWRSKLRSMGNSSRQ